MSLANQLDKRRRILWLHLDEESTSKVIFLDIIWISLALRIETGKEVVVRDFEQSCTYIWANSKKWWVLALWTWKELATCWSSSHLCSIGQRRRPVMSFCKPRSAQDLIAKGVVGEKSMFSQPPSSSLMRRRSSARASLAPFWILGCQKISAGAGEKTMHTDVVNLSRSALSISGSSRRVWNWGTRRKSMVYPL
jgi:hypothetical protein